MAFPHCDEAWKKFEVNPLDIGEIHYGQGNYYAAMQNFIAALIFYLFGLVDFFSDANLVNTLFLF